MVVPEQKRPIKMLAMVVELLYLTLCIVLSAVVDVLAGLAELAFTVWLLWKGVDVERREARARHAF